MGKKEKAYSRVNSGHALQLQSVAERLRLVAGNQSLLNVARHILGMDAVGQPYSGTQHKNRENPFHGCLLLAFRFDRNFVVWLGKQRHSPPVLIVRNIFKSFSSAGKTAESQQWRCDVTILAFGGGPLARTSLAYQSEQAMQERQKTKQAMVKQLYARRSQTSGG